MNETAAFVIRHGYAVLFFWILGEQAALPIPSVPLLLACGALVRSGHMRPEPILLLGIIACLIADGAWFRIGQTKGSSVLRFLCRMALEPDSCVRQTENGFVRYGVRFLLVSKFIPGMSALAAPLAGSGGAGWLQFLFFDAVGTVLWIGAWGTVGYLFSNQLDVIGTIIGRTGFQLFLVIVISVGSWIAFKYLQRRRFIKGLAVARITVEELHDLLSANEPILVIDVRGKLATPSEPIPGALRIPLSEVEARQREIPRDRDVVLFCT